jgi:hypothetical protein
LPVPRLDDDDVTLLDPDPVLHATGDATHPCLTVGTPDTNVIPPVVVCDDTEQLVVVWHSEIPMPRIVTHSIVR